MLLPCEYFARALPCCLAILSPLLLLLFLSSGLAFVDLGSVTIPLFRTKTAGYPLLPFTILRLSSHPSHLLSLTMVGEDSVVPLREPSRIDYFYGSSHYIERYFFPPFPILIVSIFSLKITICCLCYQYLFFYINSSFFLLCYYSKYVY